MSGGLDFVLRELFGLAEGGLESSGVGPEKKRGGAVEKQKWVRDVGKSDASPPRIGEHLEIGPIQG